MMKIKCECDSFACHKQIVVSETAFAEIVQMSNVFAIHDDCEQINVVRKQDTLVEQRKGYALYRES